MTKNTELGKSPKKPMPAAGSRNGVVRKPIDGASINDLSKRLGEIEGVNEDMAMFLAHNWQRFVGALVVVLLIAVLVYQYRSTQETRMADAAERLEKVSSEFGLLVAPPQPAAKTEDKKDQKDQAKDAAKTDDPEKREPNPEEGESSLFKQLKLLQSTQSDTIYGRLAGLYSAEARIAQKNFDAARAELAKFDTKKFTNVTQAKLAVDVKENDLVDELAALTAARLAIEEGKTPPAEIEKQLTGLIYGGKFLNLEALLALYRISQTPEQRQAAARAAQSLLSARPELRETITQQLSTNGISID